MLVTWIWVMAVDMAVQRWTPVEYSLEAEPLDLLLAYTWAAGGRGQARESLHIKNSRTVRIWVRNDQLLWNKIGELKQKRFCSEGWQPRFIKRVWMESSLVTAMIKIITAQTQQMALYFVAKETGAPLQRGLKEIWVTVGLKVVPKDGLYWAIQNTSKVSREICAVNRRVIHINTVTRRNEDRT